MENCNTNSTNCGSVGMGMEIQVKGKINHGKWNELYAYKQMWTESKQIHQMRKWTLYMYIILKHTLTHTRTGNSKSNKNTLNLMQHFVDRAKWVAMKQLRKFEILILFFQVEYTENLGPKTHIPQMIVFLFNWNKCHKEIFHPHRFVISHIFRRCKCFFLYVSVCARAIGRERLFFEGFCCFGLYACVWVPFLDLFYFLLCRFTLKHMGNYFWFKPKGTSDVRIIRRKVENEWEKPKSKNESERAREKL